MSCKIPRTFKEKTPCIYYLRCVPTGDQYIGSTVDFDHRTRKHMQQLVRGKHPNPHLQNAWNKYKWFDIGIIYQWDGPVSLAEIRHYENQYIRLRKPAYNICEIATYSIMSQERKARMSARFAKSFVMVDPSGKEIEVTNLARFCAERGLNANAIRGVVAGRRSGYKGWKGWHKDSPCHYVNRRERIWIVTSPEGNVYTVQGLKNLCQIHGLSDYCLRHIAYGKQSHHKGWKCQRGKT